MILQFDPKRHRTVWRALVQASAEAVDEALDDLVALGRAGLGLGGAVTSVADVLDAGEETTLLAEALPRRYVDRYTLLFLKKFIACLMHVASKLVSAEAEPLACTAEELAMWAVLEQAKGLLELYQGEARDPGNPFTRLRADRDPFGRIEDLVFEDTDFLNLFDDEQDGIDESPVGAYLGMQSLRFDTWFVPFNADCRVHPYVT